LVILSWWQPPMNIAKKAYIYIVDFRSNTTRGC
jgi:hypothetical protein